MKIKKTYFNSDWTCHALPFWVFSHHWGCIHQYFFWHFCCFLKEQWSQREKAPILERPGCCIAGWSHSTSELLSRIVPCMGDGSHTGTLLSTKAQGYQAGHTWVGARAGWKLELNTGGFSPGVALGTAPWHWSWAWMCFSPHTFITSEHSCSCRGHMGQHGSPVATGRQNTSFVFQENPPLIKSPEPGARFLYIINE